MKKINFNNLPDTTTPINNTNLNTLQNNVEEVFNGNEPMGSIVVDDISCTDPTKYFGYTSGSNENGSWVKYDDGRMECFLRKTFSEVPVQTAIGSLYESASLNIGDYPVPFVDIPSVHITPNGQFFVRVIGAPSATSYGTFRAVRPTTATGMEVTVSVEAKGYWK